MGDVAGSGRQLFFDLIAAAGDPGPRSAFETAAWQIAAERAGAHGAATNTLDPPTADRDEAEDAPAIAAVDVPDGPASTAGLHLIDEPDEPPLHPLATTALPGTGPTPGPRVSAFAAATGAAIAPHSPPSETPATYTTAAGSEIGIGAPPAAEPANAAQPHLATAAGPYTDHDADRREAVGQLGPGGPPLIPTTTAAAPDSAIGTVGQADPQPAEQAAQPSTVGSSSPPSTVRGSDESTSRSAVPSSGLSPLDVDDDFGPLVVPEPARRFPGRRGGSGNGGDGSRHRRRGRRLAVALAGVTVLVACAALAWVNAGPAAAPPAAVSEVSMVPWRGIALPVSTAAGPAERTDTVVSGFAATPLGAAIAAAHLSVRTDPAAGPRVFEPVLADQVVGARARLANAVRDQHERVPERGAPGTLLGWRVDDNPAAGSVTVHLAVQHADGTRGDYAIALAWVDGDWRIDAPPSGPFFPITELSGAYTPFVEEAA